MELVTFEEFMARTMGGAPPGTNYDVRGYVAHPFECACGSKHAFDPKLWIRELRGIRLVHGCPFTDSITCIKATGFIRFKGFRSEFGVRNVEAKEE